jgi:hypothetical protein
LGLGFKTPVSIPGRREAEIKQSKASPGKKHKTLSENKVKKKKKSKTTL